MNPLAFLNRYAFAACYLFVAVLVVGLSQAGGADSSRILTRVFFQDDDVGAIQWADVLWGQPPTLGPVRPVAGFPKLDSERQTLVQMRAAGGMLLVGVRDDSGGTFQSGWVLIDSGVKQEPHGDHSHWSYPQAPRVRAATLDEKQGNPAHVYCYEGIFYVANDRLNGYTRLDLAEVAAQDTAEKIRSRAAFHQGGGNHITLAVSGNFGFSAWIDREGENRGRVDITALKPRGNTRLASSFQLPSGGIHGAIANQGKVFFAPSDGIWWVAANQAPNFKANTIHHLSLGKKDETPRRTGAFVNLGRYIGFVAGAGDDATLGLIDVAQANPAVVQVPLDMADGNRPAGLTMAISRGGKPLAFVFHDHAQDVEAPDLLSIVELDPNSDKDFADAKVAAAIAVGRARVEGHSGHHSLDLDAERRRAIIANPGDGTLATVSLADRTIEQEFKVGGAPSSIVCIGGRQEAD
jgi:hypothetical protein